MSFLSQPISLVSIFGAGRKIGTISVDAVINEETNDTLTITKQPVQQGASITDHSYLEPTAFSMTILQQVSNPVTQLLGTFAGAGNSGLAQVYQDFLKLQATSKPFIIATPKRIYNNMLMTTIRQVTDKRTENILSLNISFQQVIIVTVGTFSVSASAQTSPQKTQPVQSTGQNTAEFDAAKSLGLNPTGFHL